MRHIIRKRGCGKSTEMIYLSSETQIPLVVMSEWHVKFALARAGELGVKIPRPVCYKDISLLQGKPEKRILVDEADAILTKLLNHEIYALSMTKGEV